jgi:hypothetical protein
MAKKSKKVEVQVISGIDAKISKLKAKIASLEAKK